MYYIFRSGSFVKNIDNVIGGFIVGSVVVLAWYLTGSTFGQEWIETNDFLDSPLPGVGVQSFTFINPMGESIIYLASLQIFII